MGLARLVWPIGSKYMRRQVCTGRSVSVGTEITPYSRTTRTAFKPDQIYSTKFGDNSRVSRPLRQTDTLAAHHR